MARGKKAQARPDVAELGLTWRPDSHRLEPLADSLIVLRLAPAGTALLNAL
jgi:hypothetical protein